MRFSAASALSASALLAGQAAAFWRMPCPGGLVRERIDPIIYPGIVSAHVHQVAGGNGFGFTEDYAQTQAAECSSCPIIRDKSNYWTPILYYWASNGSFIQVPQAGDAEGVLGGMTVYYEQRPGPNNDSLVAFPEGFRMVAGNPFVRNYTGDFAAQAISFACLDYRTGATQYPYTNSLPNYSCYDGVRAQVYFPSCWDGVNLDSPDHSSHVAYPVQGYNDGSCPDSHPVHFTSIFYEVTFQTDNFMNDWSSAMNTSQPFVFAMGDPYGYGFHGDFVNGWDVEYLQEAIDTCNADSGLISDCALLQNELYTDEQCQACQIPPQVDENIAGPFDSLPGCNPVTFGPGQAVPVTDCAITPISPPETYFTDVTQTLKWKYLGCGNDSISARTLSGSTESLDTMSVEECIKFCISGSYSIAGMEYGSQCYCGNSFPAANGPQTGILGNCFMPCAGDSGEICGGASAISLYEACGSGSCTNAQYQAVGNGTVSNVVVASSSSSSSSSSTPSASSSSSSSSAASSSSVKTSSSSTATSSSAKSSSTTASAESSASSSVSTAATTASTSTGSSTSSAATGHCSELSNPYTDSNDIAYTLQCGYDLHDEGDLSAVDNMAMFSDCFAECDAYDGCEAFSYTGTTCFLKKLVGATPTSANGVSIAYLSADSGNVKRRLKAHRAARAHAHRHAHVKHAKAKHEAHHA